MSPTIFVRTLVPTLSLTVVATGCAMLMKGGGAGNGTPVANPLTSGQPLQASRTWSAAGTQEEDCNVWPFEDTLTVEVTAQQICVTQKKHIERQDGWTGEPNANSSEGISIDTDSGKNGYINADKKRVAKVGSCFNHGWNTQIDLFAFEYQGCTPNDGIVGDSTTYLRVDNESWSFPAANPPANAQPGAEPVAATARTAH